MTRIEENSVDIEKWMKLIRADGVGPEGWNKAIGQLDRLNVFAEEQVWG